VPVPVSNKKTLFPSPGKREGKSEGKMGRLCNYFSSRSSTALCWGALTPSWPWAHPGLRHPAHPNFAHGHLYMLGAYISFFLMTLYGFGFWTALVSSMVILGLIGMLIERVVYRPLQDKPHINSFISAVGALIILETGSSSCGGPRPPDSQPLPRHRGIGGNYHEPSADSGHCRRHRHDHRPPDLYQKNYPGTTIEAVAQNREGPCSSGSM